MTTTSNTLNEFHVIESGDENVLFHSPTLTLFRVDHYGARIIKDYIQGMTSKEISLKHNIREKSIHQLFEKLQRIQTLKEEIDLKQQDDEVKNRKISLMMNVSNDCNLRCKYCYADGGTYGGKHSLMKMETAIKTIDVMYKYFDEIAAITFFGGEPTLNIKVIQNFCNYLDTLFKNGKIINTPTLGMVTNGIIHTSDVIETVKRYNILVTISVDGTKEINDQLRVHPDGSGTFDEIKEAFFLFKEHTGRTPDIEATFTQLHLDNGLNLMGLTDYLTKEFNFRYNTGVIADVLVPKEHPLYISHKFDDIFLKAASESIDSLATGSLRGSFHFIEGLVPLITKKPSAYLCPIGITTYAISVDGDIYPCHLFVNKPEFKMGNVYTVDFENPDEKYLNVFNNLSQYIKKDNNPICRKCWARGLCKGCPASMYFMTGDISKIPPETYCAYRKRNIENSLIQISRIQNDPIKWRSFVNRMKQSFNNQSELQIV